MKSFYLVSTFLFYACSEKQAQPISSAPANVKPQPVLTATSKPGCSLPVVNDAYMISAELGRTLWQEPWRVGATASISTLGVKLDSVSTGSIAACVGLQKDDVLFSVGGVPLQDPLGVLSSLEARLQTPGLLLVKLWRHYKLVGLQIFLAPALNTAQSPEL